MERKRDSEHLKTAHLHVVTNTKCTHIKRIMENTILSPWSLQLYLHLTPAPLAHFQSLLGESETVHLQDRNLRLGRKTVAHEPKPLALPRLLDDKHLRGDHLSERHEQRLQIRVCDVHRQVVNEQVRAFWAYASRRTFVGTLLMRAWILAALRTQGVPSAHPIIAVLQTYAAIAQLRAVRERAIRSVAAVPYKHLRPHETVLDVVWRLLLEKKNFI